MLGTGGGERERKGQRDKMQDLNVTVRRGYLSNIGFMPSQYFGELPMEKLRRWGQPGEASLSRQHAGVSQKMNPSGCWKYRGNQERVPLVKELPFWWREIDKK